MATKKTATKARPAVEPLAFPLIDERSLSPVDFGPERLNWECKVLVRLQNGRRGWVTVFDLLNMVYRSDLPPPKQAATPAATSEPTT